MMPRKTKSQRLSTPKSKRQLPNEPMVSDSGQCPVFMFDRIDVAGDFAFNYGQAGFNHQLVLEKIIDYSRMTWAQIRQQTHDRKNKSKHHALKNIERLSRAAQERLKYLGVGEDENEYLFSFALNNTVRIIGVRDKNDGPAFHVLWYDPNHEVYPVAG